MRHTGAKGQLMRFGLPASAACTTGGYFRRLLFCNSARLDVVSAQTAEILSNDLIDLSCFYILQQILKTGTLEIESGETVIHIVIKDAEPVLLAELAQHRLLCPYAYTFTDLFIIFAQATINCCSF